jgi:hypothetical protein
MNKLMLNVRDDLNVICNRQGCILNKQVIKFSKYVIHAQECLKKVVECPNKCTYILISIEEAESHFEHCPKQ